MPGETVARDSNIVAKRREDGESERDKGGEVQEGLPAFPWTKRSLFPPRLFYASTVVRPSPERHSRRTNFRPTREREAIARDQRDTESSPLSPSSRDSHEDRERDTFEGTKALAIADNILAKAPNNNDDGDDDGVFDE